MATVGTIAVSLVARTGAFIGKMRKAGSSLNSFGKSASRSVASLRGFASSLAGLAIGGGIVVGIKSMISSIDKLAKTSSKLGLTVNELQSLRLAAEFTGVATNTLDMALQRMVRRVSEAAEGTGEAKAAIAELGLDAKKLAAGGPYQALMDIADAMLKVEGSGGKVRIAFKLFDSEGAALVNTLRGGSRGLKAYAAEAEALGLFMGEKSVAQIVRLSDQLTRIKYQFTALGRTILIGVIGPLESFITIVRGTTSELQSLGLSLSVLGEWWNALSDNVTFAALTIEIAAGTIGKAWSRMLTINTLAIVGFIEDTKHMANTVVEIVKWMATNWREVLNTIWEATKSFAVNVGKNLVELTESLQTFATGGGFHFEWTGLLDGFESTLKDFPEIAERTLTDIEKTLIESLAGTKDFGGLFDELVNSAATALIAVDEHIRQREEKEKERMKLLKDRAAAAGAAAGAGADKVQMARTFKATGSVEQIARAFGGPNTADGLARKALGVAEKQLDALNDIKRNTAGAGGLAL